MNKIVSVVVPMYFEEDVVNECYKRLTNVLNKIKNYSYEIIFVDDGSRDNTFSLLKEIALNDKKVKVISFSRNFGHESAVTSGLKFASGNAIVIIDSDLQDPPEEIPKMLKYWEDGYDVIYGKRKSRSGESKFKLFTANMFYKTLSALSDTEIPENTGSFRLVDKKVVDAINQLPEHNKFLRGLFSWVGYKQIAYEYERKERIAGKTKYTLTKMLKLATDGIIGFSTKPLKIVGTLGILSIIVSIGLLIYSLISYIFKLNTLVPGWTSIMVTVTFFCGVQLLSLFLISEYISRIYDETKNRPQYIIDKKINIE